MLKMNGAISWQGKGSPPSALWRGIHQGLPVGRHNTDKTESEFRMGNSMRIWKSRENPPLKDQSAVFAYPDLCTGVYQFI